MSFPAYDDLAADIELGFMTWRVYMYLQRNLLNHIRPTEVKVWYLSDTLHIGKRHIIRALNWLVEKGYLVEFDRPHPNAIRSFTLAWARRAGPDVVPEKKAS